MDTQKEGTTAPIKVIYKVDCNVLPCLTSGTPILKERYSIVRVYFNWLSMLEGITIVNKVLNTVDRK